MSERVKIILITCKVYTAIGYSNISFIYLYIRHPNPQRSLRKLSTARYMKNMATGSLNSLST